MAMAMPALKQKQQKLCLCLQLRQPRPRVASPISSVTSQLHPTLSAPYRSLSILFSFFLTFFRNIYTICLELCICLDCIIAPTYPTFLQHVGIFWGWLVCGDFSSVLPIQDHSLFYMSEFGGLIVCCCTLFFSPEQSNVINHCITLEFSLKLPFLRYICESCMLSNSRFFHELPFGIHLGVLHMSIKTIFLNHSFGIQQSALLVPSTFGWSLSALFFVYSFSSNSRLLHNPVSNYCC